MNTSMTVPLTRAKPVTSTRLHVAHILTAAIIVLAVVAATGGLFIPGLYRDHPALVPVLQGQDLVTLLALPILVVTLLAAQRGSTRATLAWIGFLGYLLYTYLGAAVAYHINSFLPIYIALFSLSTFTLVATVSSLDATALRQRFDSAAPRMPVTGFLLLTAVMLSLAEGREILAFLTAGTLPPLMARTGGTTFFVYALDLGFVAPLCILASIWLWRQAAWGYILASCLLIKAATMGLALLSMDWFAGRAGLPSDGLEGIWTVITAGGLGLSIWLFQHCRE